MTLQAIPPKTAFRVPFSGKSRNYSAAEMNAVIDAMKKADPETQGVYQTRFQDAFAQLIGTPNAFAVSSATAALELAAILSGLEKGDEVIIPAHTFAATAIPFARTGAQIVWADIDPETWVVSAESIEKNISPRTKVIVVVHLYGLAAAMDPIMELAKKRRLIVVEDCAQALGAEFHHQKVGSFGDFGCFSFHSHKNITTLGEGGMLTVRSAEIAGFVPGLRHNGIHPFPAREHYWKPAMSLVDFDLEGVWPYNFCVGEAQCALGMELLKSVDSINLFRKKRAMVFRQTLRDFPELTFQSLPESQTSSFHLLPARYTPATPNISRDDLIALLAYEYGIQLVVQYYPLYRYPMFQKAGLGNAHCPKSDSFFDHMVSFPFHEWLSEDDFQYMINSTQRALLQLRERKPS